MGQDNNLMDLCFELTDKYEQYFKAKLLENALSQRDADEIVANFDFRREIILSINREYKKGARFENFCRDEGISEELPSMLKFDGKLYHHQEEAIKSILNGTCTVISTGTGSGKTESFLIPVLNYCLGSKKKGIKAIIIYPMNALASDQMRRISEAVEGTSVTFGIFTGETPNRGKDVETSNFLSNNQLLYREDIIEGKPDILVTNYVMLDHILTDPVKRKMIEQSQDTLKYIVVDEIHTYRGNKGAHLKYLLLRLKEYFGEDAVQIGCSATLNRNEDGERQDGYLGSGGIDAYIKKMFSVDRYNYIEPVYNDEAGWITCEQEYLELKNSPVTIELKEFLMGGSRTLSEILRMLQDKGLPLGEADFRKYLKNIVDMNNRFSDHPVLDFRVHLFLLEISNILKRCIKCGRYHTGTTMVCTSCGQPVFAVYRKDFTKCIGKVYGNHLTNNFAIYHGEEETGFSVLIENERLGLESRRSDYERLSFKAHYQITEEGIRLEHDSEGKLYLFYLPDSEGLGDDAIVLGSPQKKEFLYSIFKQSLLNVSGDEKKILAFVDNRERSGRYSAIFNDEFLGDFFTECVKLVNGRRDMQSIADVYENTLEELSEFLQEKDETVLSGKIIQEFKIWFTRSISIPEDSKLEKTLSIRLMDDSLLTDNGEREFVDILLKEKVLDRAVEKKKGDFIRFHCGHSRYKNVAVLESGIGNREGIYSILSFGSSAQKYREFVNINKDRLKIFAGSLVSKGILKEERLESNSLVYYLNRNKVRFKTGKSEYECIGDIVHKELLFSGAHSSEVLDDIKRRHEADFQNGKLNLLLSTPTLEMGIDIGKLNMVYMIGVPPMPSNYAQRAGRAGRRSNRFALIVTICSENNNHDMYYFGNPKGMIEGVITPPNFNDRSREIIKKHISALLIPDKVKVDAIKHSERCFAVFGGEVDYGAYLKELSQIWTDKGSEIRSHQNFYDMGIYPDYSFRRDEVKAVDIRFRKAASKNISGEDKDYILSIREPEQAYKDFVPDKSQFLGEEYYRFTSNGEYRIVDLEGEGAFREYSIIYCDGDIQDIRKGREVTGYDTEVRLTPGMDKVHPDLRADEIVTAFFEKELPIYFINRGRKTKNGIVSFSDPEGTFSLGYKLERDSLLFGFNRDVVSEESAISLCAAIDRTVKDALGFDESEIGWIMGEHLEFKGRDEGKYYILMYDKTGCGNLDLERIFKEMKSLLKLTYDKLRGCSCESQGGCYICMKGYSVQWYAQLMNKRQALMFIGFLLGLNKFKPNIVIEEETSGYDMELQLKLDTADKRIEIMRDNDVLCSMKFDEQNPAIFSGLCSILKSRLSSESVESILIAAKQDYIVKAINATGSLNSGIEELKLFKFYSLGFKKVEGVKM